MLSISGKLGASDLPNGIPMEELFWEISNSLQPFGKPGLLVAAIIRIRAKGLTVEMVGAMGTGVRLSCYHFLPEDQKI